MGSIVMLHSSSGAGAVSFRVMLAHPCTGPAERTSSEQVPSPEAASWYSAVARGPGSFLVRWRLDD